MIQKQHYEDYELNFERCTAGRTITEADFVIHAGHTGDFFPHHVDAEWCKSQPFGQRIAHGTMIFAIGVGLTASRINPVAMTYGYDRLRFIKPVHIGDTIYTKIIIADKQNDPKSPQHGRVVERLTVHNQHGETVMATDHILRVQKRPAGTAS